MRIKSDFELSPEDERVKKWRLSSNIVLLYSKKYYKNLYELESDYDAYDALPNELKFDSDEESIRIFQLGNDDRYQIMKNKFMNEVDKDVPVFKAKYVPAESLYNHPETIMTLMRESAEKEELEMLAKTHPETVSYSRSLLQHRFLEENGYIPDDLYLPMYTPKEMLAMGTSYSDKCLFTESSYIPEDFDPNEWFAEYKAVWFGSDDSKYRELYPKWKDTVKELYSMKESCDEEEQDKYNQSLIDLGWNPAIKPTDIMMDKVCKRSKVYMNMIATRYHIYDMNQYFGEVIPPENYMKDPNIFYYLGIRCGSDLENDPYYTIFNLKLYTNNHRLLETEYGYRDIDINIDIVSNNMIAGHYKNYHRKFEDIFLVRFSREEALSILDAAFNIEDKELYKIYDTVHSVKIDKSNRLGIKLFINKTLFGAYPVASEKIFHCKYDYYNNIINKLNTVEWIHLDEQE